MIWLVVMETQAANATKREKANKEKSGGAGDGELLQVIHEHLKADVIGQDGSARLLKHNRPIIFYTLSSAATRHAHST